MATSDQSDFIKDLVLQKFGDFKSFKSWLATTGIIRTNGQIFKKGVTLPEITNRITTSQASAIITELQGLDDRSYVEKYDPETIKEVQNLIAEIETEVQSWTFTNQ